MSSSKHQQPTIPEDAADGLSDAVDIAVLRRLQAAQVDGEPDVVVELIDLYLDDTPRRLADISTFLVQGDALSLRQAAHGLKGSSATLGAGRTARLCEEIEQLAVDNSLVPAATLVNKLEDEFARVRQAFLWERQRRTGET
jgi:HPt (histidine-containing phosphotransfer) domain-containing protein